MIHGPDQIDFLSPEGMTTYEVLSDSIPIVVWVLHLSWGYPKLRPYKASDRILWRIP